MIKPGSVLLCRVATSTTSYLPPVMKKFVTSAYQGLKSDKILTVFSSKMIQGCNLLMTAEEGEVWLMQFSAFEIISRPKHR